MTITDNGLHIIGGDSAAGCFMQAFKMHERLLIHHDMLSFGPTPQCTDIHSWKRVRLDYLQALFEDIMDVDFDASRKDLVANAGMLIDAELIYIWATTGIEDQLLILFVIYLTEMLGADPSKIKINLFEKMPDRDYSPSSMGQISPEQMVKHPAPITLDQNTINLYRSAWLAYSAETPVQISQIISSPGQHNKYILQTLALILRRYPDIKTGLGYWDYQLLINCKKHGPLAAKTIGYTIGSSSDEGDYVGDYYLFTRLKYLASKELTKPLIIYTGEQDTFRGASVALTEFGEAVLDRRLSSYPVNPIDEWVGGVHLSSEKCNLWFYNNGRLVDINET